MQREMRLRIEPRDFNTLLRGVSPEERGLATWEVSLNVLQARDLRDAFLARRNVSESFEKTPGWVRFPDGQTFDTCRVNIVKDPLDWSRIWVDYLAPGEDPDAPWEDVLAVELDDQLACRLGRIWQLCAWPAFATLFASVVVRLHGSRSRTQPTKPEPEGLQW